jgi:hypothetical protein
MTFEPNQVVFATASSNTGKTTTTRPVASLAPEASVDSPKEDMMPPGSESLKTCSQSKQSEDTNSKKGKNSIDSASEKSSEKNKRVCNVKVKTDENLDKQSVLTRTVSCSSEDSVAGWNGKVTLGEQSSAKPGVDNNCAEGQNDTGQSYGSDPVGTTDIPINRDTFSNAESDISSYIGKSVEDTIKYNLITERMPEETFDFPRKLYKDSKRKKGVYSRNCQHDWLKTFNFVTYSKKEDGLYCLACCLFPSEPHRGRCARLLITEPYSNWKDAKADLSKHSGLDYHLDSAAKLKGFIQTMENQKSRIDISLSSSRQEQIAKNRLFLLSIIKCLEFCGKQGIALRGHRDDATSSALNQGNFKALLQLRIDAGDTALACHLETCNKNATYI